MSAQIIIMADHRKPKVSESKELTYAEWVRFCLDPFDLLQTTPKPKSRK